jgi:hypothetical protein
VRGYLESSLRYWSAVAELVQQTNAEITKVVAGRGQEWAGVWQRAAGGVPTAMPQAFGAGFAKPLFDAFEAARASQAAMLQSFAAFAPRTARQPDAP